MANYLRYGSWSAGEGTAIVVINRTTKFNDAMQPLAVIERWIIDLWVLAASGNLTTQLAAVEAAFARDRQNISFFHHQIRNSDTLGGVRVVVRPSYPDGTGVELVTKRIVHIEVEAELPLSGSANMLLSFNEEITADAEPTVGYLSTLTGRAVGQTLRRRPIYTYTQRGSAVGYGKYPVVSSIAPPLWPSKMIKPSTPSYGTPKKIGNFNYTEYPVSWEYVFQSPGPLNGKPNMWR